MTAPAREVTDLIDHYTTHLRILGRRPKTINSYRQILARADRELPYGLESAYPEELTAWIWADNRSKEASKLYRAAIVGFYAWACPDPDDLDDNAWLDQNPARRLPGVRVEKGRPRPITAAQHHDILARAADPYWLWYLIAAYQGMRCCEIAELDRGDVYETVTFVNGKGGKSRRIPTHPAVWDAVRDLPAGLIAGGATAEAVSDRGNRHLCRLGHQDVTMHRLRHWYGTNVNDAGGGDLRMTQELLGHSSPDTTSIYVATVSDKATAAVRALPPPPSRGGDPT